MNIRDERWRTVGGGGMNRIAEQVSVPAAIVLAWVDADFRIYIRC